jgi:hypothetical protein
MYDYLDRRQATVPATACKLDFVGLTSDALSKLKRINRQQASPREGIMTSKNLFVFIATLVVWFVSTIASAQPAPGEMIQLRSDDPRCGEGFTCFQVGPYRPGADLSFERMLERVNRGVDESRHVTIQQLENANECGVIYVRGRSSHIQGANGVCETRNRTSERVTFASFCGAESSCSRWPLANRVYRVPSVRILTPGERAEELARRIEDTVPAATIEVPAEMGSWLTEVADLTETEQPPSMTQVASVLRAAGNAIQRVHGIDPSSPTESEAVETPPIPISAPERTNIEELRGRVASLQMQLGRMTVERNEARANLARATNGMWPWWVTIIACLIGMALLFFIGRKTAPVIATVPVAEEDPKPSSSRELEEVREQLRTAENAVDTLRAKIAAIEDVFMNLNKTNERPGDFNQVIAFVKNAGAFMATWIVPLKGETPDSLCEKLASAGGNVVDQGDAANFRKMRDEWQRTPDFNLPFTIEGIMQVVRAWLRLDSLTVSWFNFEPAFVPTNAPDGGLQTYIRDQLHDMEKIAHDDVSAQIGERADLALDELAPFMPIGDDSQIDHGTLKRLFGIRSHRKAGMLMTSLQRILTSILLIRAATGRIETDRVTPVPDPFPPPPSIPAEAKPVTSPFGSWEDPSAESEEDSDIGTEETVVGPNPLLEAEKVAVTDAADEVRDDEKTGVFHLEGHGSKNGRQRRTTDRGFPVAVTPVPVTGGTPPDGSS